MTESSAHVIPMTRIERIGGLVLCLFFLSLPAVRLYQVGPALFLRGAREWALSSGWPWITAPRGLLVVASVLMFVMSTRPRLRSFRLTMLIMGFGFLLPTLLGSGSSAKPADLFGMSLLFGVSVLLGIIQAAGPEATRRAQ